MFYRVASETSSLVFYIYHGKDDENASSHILVVFSSFNEISDLVFDLLICVWKLERKLIVKS